LQKHVYFAILPERTVNENAFNSLIDVAAYAGAMQCARIPVSYQRTDVARNGVEKKFLELSSDPDDTLVFLDSDHLFPQTIIRDLVNDDKPVVAALAFRRGPPFYPCAFKKDNNGILKPIHVYEKTLMRVDAVGFPAVAIKRSVFEKLNEEGFTNYPHFCYEYPPGSFPSEDMFFSEICNRAGIELWLDTNLVCPHLFTGFIDESSWKQFRQEHTAGGGKVSVVVASSGDQNKLRHCLDSLMDVSPEVECILMMRIGESIEGLPAQVKRIIISKSKTYAEAIDFGVTYAKGTHVLGVGDNVLFRPGWLEAALSACEAVPKGVVSTTNKGQPGFVLASKDFLGANEIKLTNPDIEARAQAKNAYAWAQASLVETWE
jgi:hypothetical protein